VVSIGSRTRFRIGRGNKKCHYGPQVFGHVTGFGHSLTLLRAAEGRVETKHPIVGESGESEEPGEPS